MYLTAEIHELIVDSDMYIVYISESLENLVYRYTSVKLVNNVATILLENVNGNVKAKFSAPLANLICETLPDTVLEDQDQLDLCVVKLLHTMRMLGDDQTAIADRSREYIKLNHDIKTRLHLIKKLSAKGELNELDKAILNAAEHMSYFMDLMMGKDNSKGNIFFVASDESEEAMDVVDQFQKALSEAAAQQNMQE